MTNDVGNPVITHGLTDYVFNWPELGIRVNVDRLEDEGSGEVAVYYLNGSTRLLHYSRLNLLASTSVAQVAKKLHENIDVDWGTIFTHVTSKTIEAQRVGQPPVKIGTQPENLETQWQLWPILEKGEPTTLYAAGGAGKSWLAEAMCAAVQFNQPILDGWLPFCANVLYLDWETTKETHERRLWAIKQGMGIGNDETYLYRFCEQPLVNDLYTIRKIISDHEIGFVVIDSQIAANGYNQDPAMNASQFYNAIRSFHCTTLTIDHLDKAALRGDKDSSVGPYGSVVKWNRSRAQFELKSVQEHGDSFLDLSLIQRKNNEGPLLKPIGIRINFVNNGARLDRVTFETIDIVKSAMLSTTASLKDRLIDLLSGGTKLSIDYLAEQLDGVSRGNITTELNRNKKLFHKFPDGWAMLTTYDR